MCVTTATVIAGIGAAASVAGAASSFAGHLTQGAAAVDTSAYQAQIARNQEAIALNNQQITLNNAQVERNNATTAQNNAIYETEVSRQQAQRSSLDAAAKEGRIKAGIAANNVDVNTGSAANVGIDQRALDKLDVETVFSNNQLRAYGYRSEAAVHTANAGNIASSAANFGYQAAAEETQAQLYEKAGGYAGTSSLLDATGGLLSSVSSIPFKWGGGSSNGNDPVNSAGSNPTDAGTWATT